MDSQILALQISEMIFRLHGFGPSQSICQPFADQVIAEAESVGVNL